MLREFLERILELRDDGQKPQEIYGVPYIGGRMVHPPMPTGVDFSTLSSIVGYERGNVEADGAFYVVSSPSRVSLIGKEHPGTKERPRHALSAAITPAEHEGYMDVERFIVYCQQMFVMDDSLKDMLAFASSVTRVEEDVYTDDGISQNVVAKRSLTSQARDSVPNPLTLHPRLTFPEIEPPEQTYIFRLRESGGLQFSLTPGSEAQYNLDCVLAIKAWLDKKTDLPVYA